MSLWCDDGSRGVFVLQPPPPPLKPREWRAPDPQRDMCQVPGCGKVAWQHWTVRPSLV